MKTTLTPKKSSVAVIALFLSAISCDVVERDPSPVFETQNIDMYLIANKAAVIDLKTIFPDFKNVDFPGNKSNVKYFNDRYVRYQSNGSAGDSFDFNVKMNNGPTISARVDVNNKGTSCETGQPFTYAKIMKDTKLVVNLFNNPEFCNYDIYAPGYGISVADARTGIDVIQNSDGILLAICACGKEGDTAILSYDPPKGFVGQVKYKYYMGVFAATGNDVVPHPVYDPSNFVYYSAHEVVIDVVDSK